MLQMTLKSNIADEIRRLHVDIRQHPLAIAKALTFAAEDVQKAERDEIRRAFDRPTPFTVNSVFKTSATPTRLQAKVWLKSRGPYTMTESGLAGTPHYLEPQVYGGGRPLKRFEKRLQDAGYLPRGMYAVPGESARLDRYGNMSAGQIVQILSQLKTFSESALQRNNAQMSKRSRRNVRKAGVFFVGRPGGGRLPLGVWQKLQGKVVPVLVFVRAPRYQRRLMFYEVAKRVTDQRFPVHLQRALDRDADAATFRRAA